MRQMSCCQNPQYLSMHVYYKKKKTKLKKSHRIKCYCLIQYWSTNCTHFHCTCCEHGFCSLDKYLVCSFFFNSPLLLGAGQRLIVSIYYNCFVHCALWNDDKQNATERNFSWSLWPDLWHYYIHYHREDSFSFHEKCTATFITPLRFGRIILWW